MTYHSDNWINEKVHDHYMEAKEYFPDDSIVGIFLQGSQNYGLDYEGSDVDTKLIVVPTFKDIAMNKKPVSTTHVRNNNEHIDWKDVRLTKRLEIYFLFEIFTFCAVPIRSFNDLKLHASL